MSIHNDHPFRPPEAERSPVRRLRGRLPSPVTLWTSGSDGQRAGLTVSSMLIADGEPGYILGVIDPLSELWDELRRTGNAVVNLLAWPQRQLADAFGYTAPAPGGPFTLSEWTETAWGPALADSTAWAGCTLVPNPPIELGWGLAVSLQIEHTSFGEDRQPLVHRRGQYFTF